MRTTVNIDDGLLETAKAQAERRGVTVGTLVEEGLRRLFLKPAGDDVLASPLPVFHASPLPGVDLTTNAGIYDVMYSEEDADHARLMHRERP